MFSFCTGTLKQFSNFTQVQTSKAHSAWTWSESNKKMLDMPSIVPNVWVNLFLLPCLPLWLCQQVYSCASNDTRNEMNEWNLVWVLLFNSNSFWILLEWNFSIALCDMTCVIIRRNIRRHFLPSRFKMIKSIIWQLQIEFYMLNKLTYWRVTIYQPFIILMNSLENHVHLIDKCMPVWRVFEIHKNPEFTWKWAVGRFCWACFFEEINKNYEISCNKW